MLEPEPACFPAGVELVAAAVASRNLLGVAKSAAVSLDCPVAARTEETIEAAAEL